MRLKSATVAGAATLFIALGACLTSEASAGQPMQPVEAGAIIPPPKFKPGTRPARRVPQQAETRGSRTPAPKRA